MDISKIDERLGVKKVIDSAGISWYNVDNLPFRVYGLLRDDYGYRRVPKDVAEATSVKVAGLAHNTSGGRVRFRTASGRIAIRATMNSICRMPHMAYTGIHGFDLYADGIFIKSFVPPYDIEGGYESVITLPSNEDRLITINFPLYNSVASLEIGLDDGFMPRCAEDYRFEKPVVFYGSSITQGGCASRPGTCYQSILSRSLDFNFINLGFSGSGRAEPAISEYMAGLDMSVFVMDYDHNAPTVEHLKKTHYNLYERIRATHPDIPYIMISRPDFSRTELSDSEKRREVILESYHRAKDAGDKNLYFIDGESFFRGRYAQLCTVDGCHPTDMGFALMAEAVEHEIRLAFTQKYL